MWQSKEPVVLMQRFYENELFPPKKKKKTTETNTTTTTTTTTNTTINNFTESAEELKKKLKDINEIFDKCYFEEDEIQDDEELKSIQHQSECILRLRILLNECENFQTNKESEFSLAQSELLKTFEKIFEIKIKMNQNNNNINNINNNNISKDAIDFNVFK
ncbi:hypothetical protein ACTFIY_005048 [Dictyostelium cf. discoideum]